jgi:hypothetical protein
LHSATELVSLLTTEAEEALARAVECSD